MMSELIYKGRRAETLSHFAQSIDVTCTELQRWIDRDLVQLELIELPEGRVRVPAHVAESIRAGLRPLQYAEGRVAT